MTHMARAFICGCGGAVLTADEVDFLRRWRPWGLILFRRNVVDPQQVAALTASFRDIVGRDDAPVLVDQEGGRVQRLAPPHWPAYPAAAKFSAATDDAREQERLAFDGARLIAHDLRAVGVTIDCLPVLDVPAPGSHSVIGDRAYAPEPDPVARLGRAAADGLLAGGVLPVVKHVPGHGRACADSHLELPVVNAPLDALRTRDFTPFRANADLPLAMTAHVVFTALDPDRPATLSPIVVDRVIRGEIGFDGCLMSDDLSMRALSGSFGERAKALFAAGLDMALHCNGDLAEAQQVAAATPFLAGRSEQRARRALAMIAAPPASFDIAAARAGLQAGLAGRVADLA